MRLVNRFCFAVLAGVVGSALGGRDPRSLAAWPSGTAVVSYESEQALTAALDRHPARVVRRRGALHVAAWPARPRSSGPRTRGCGQRTWRRSSSRRPPAGASWNAELGYGVLDVAAAVANAQTASVATVAAAPAGRMAPPAAGSSPG